MKKLSKQEKYRRYLQSLHSKNCKILDNSAYLSRIKGGFKITQRGTFNDNTK